MTAVTVAKDGTAPIRLVHLCLGHYVLPKFPRVQHAKILLLLRRQITLAINSSVQLLLQINTQSLGDSNQALGQKLDRGWRLLRQPRRPVLKHHARDLHVQPIRYKADLWLRWLRKTFQMIVSRIQIGRDGRSNGLALTQERRPCQYSIVQVNPVSSDTRVLQDPSSADIKTVIRIAARLTKSSSDGAKSRIRLEFSGRRLGSPPLLNLRITLKRLCPQRSPFAIR